MFVFKALNGLAPSYLSELLTVRNPGRALRSTNQLLLEVSRSKYKPWGPLLPPGSGTSSPPQMRLISDLGLFKSGLKPTYLGWLLMPSSMETRLSYSILLYFIAFTVILLLFFSLIYYLL